MNFFEKLASLLITILCAVMIIGILLAVADAIFGVETVTDTISELFV